ncbi:hypothetical protein IRJ41_018843 [Triplophysa rosa]|uniref:Uncharacterized protein n=1 Tax=Triplophysa rosa TaxID=992332 RepID=A0A9W7T7K0_TRIRA|nr:hypothetical protein IRJ41_018843 [Triplophysa rosa]
MTYCIRLKCCLFRGVWGCRLAPVWAFLISLVLTVASFNGAGNMDHGLSGLGVICNISAMNRKSETHVCRSPREFWTTPHFGQGLCLEVHLWVYQNYTDLYLNPPSTSSLLLYITGMAARELAQTIPTRGAKYKRHLSGQSDTLSSLLEAVQFSPGV